MDILKLMIVFGVLVVMLWLKRPLYQGILGAAAAVCILFGICSDFITNSKKGISKNFLLYFGIL